MKLLIFLTILCVTSCGSPTTYRPDVYGHDYMNMTIIEPISKRRISCGDEEFNEYASVKLKDIVKIATVLKKAKLPRHIRILIEDFETEIKELEKLQKLEPLE